MLKNLFSLLLSIVFVILVLLFAYKNISKPEIAKVSLNEASVVSQKSTDTESNKSYSQKDIELIIKNYILANPEIIIESIENLHKHNMKESGKKAGEYLKDNKVKIETEGSPPIIGNPEGDVTIVMFYDYNCTYCKKANIVINNLVNSDPGVKLILRPIPVLGESSLYAAKAFLAMQKIAKDDYPKIHNDMMKMKNFDHINIKTLSQKYNINYSVLENEINSYAVKQLIAQNYDFAKSLNITGAPSYIINGIFAPGFIPEDKFQNIILQIRASSQDQASQK